MNVDEASPLQEIERRVQVRAKETSLDMAGDGGRAQLRSLIAQEVAGWSDGYKRGLRSFDLADPDVVAERAYRNLVGYGPLEPLLADDDVWEIMVVVRDDLGFSRNSSSEGISHRSELLLSEPDCPPFVVQMWCRCGADPCTLTMEGMGPGSANVTASVLLVIGYPLALGVLARLRPVLAERRVWWFAALEAATASITAGWLLHRRPLPAAVNGAALVGLAIAWLITGRRAGPNARKAR